LGLGSETHKYLTELVHRRPRIWISDVERLHELLQSRGEQALPIALRQALGDRLYGAEYVRHYLAQSPMPQETR
jgi:hypothetical protein